MVLDKDVLDTFGVPEFVSEDEFWGVWKDMQQNQGQDKVNYFPKFVITLNQLREKNRAVYEVNQKRIMSEITSGDSKLGIALSICRLAYFGNVLKLNNSVNISEYDLVVLDVMAEIINTKDFPINLGERDLIELNQMLGRKEQDLPNHSKV